MTLETSVACRAVRIVTHSSSRLVSSSTLPTNNRRDTTTKAPRIAHASGFKSPKTIMYFRSVKGENLKP